MSKKFMSEGAQVMHEMAQDLYEDGIIDVARMREYDGLCFADTSKPETIGPSARSETSRLTSITAASVPR